MSAVKPYVKPRNPLAAEKTPRKEKNFNFGVPEVPDNLRKIEKWSYPTEDYGLMAKFSSQQSVYNKIYEKKKHFEDTVSKFRADKLNQVDNNDDSNNTGNNTLNSEFKLTSRIPTQPQISSRSDHLNTGRSTGRKTLNNDTITARDDIPLETVLDNTDPNNLYDSKISGFKGLAKYNPEILAKWRAKRAAEFVLEQKHPLDPPTARDLTARPFKPGGTIPVDPSGVGIKTKYVSKSKKTNNMKANNVNAELSTSRMQGTLGELLEQLNQTQSEIERQELKIALKTKSNPFGKK